MSSESLVKKTLKRVIDEESFTIEEIVDLEKCIVLKKQKIIKNEYENKIEQTLKQNLTNKDIENFKDFFGDKNIKHYDISEVFLEWWYSWVDDTDRLFFIINDEIGYYKCKAKHCLGPKIHDKMYFHAKDPDNLRFCNRCYNLLRNEARHMLDHLEECHQNDCDHFLPQLLERL